MYRNLELLNTFLTSNSNDDLELLLIATQNEEAERRNRRRRGSAPGRRVINRDRAGGHIRLYQDYFSDNPTYSDDQFRRRFRMRRPLFCRILNAVESYNPFFVQRNGAIGVPGLSSLQKVIVSLRILAYGIPADLLDDHIRIGQSTSLDRLRHFVEAIVVIFSEVYLRTPTETNLSRLLQVNEQRGFPGVLGSIDCMHWQWKNCPTAWKGMYTGHSRSPTIVLEAVASQDLWIWHVCFGMPGSVNDINVLDRSHVFLSLTKGRVPPVNLIVNGNNYSMGYYLADGIYSFWTTFVETICAPQGKTPRRC